MEHLNIEFNDLIESGDWLELRHVRDYPSEKGHIIICRFNAALVSKAQAQEVAAQLGYPLSATLGEFFDEISRGDFSKWDVKG